MRNVEGQDMGGKRGPGASVGAAWIHVVEPTQPHIQNDAAVDLAMPMIVYGLTSITMSDHRYRLGYANQDLTRV